MVNYFIFVFYLYIILFSIIGYGFILKFLFSSKVKFNLSFSEQCFYGLFFLLIISVSTSFFIPHNYFHNVLIHSIGIIFFYNSKIWRSENKNFKILLSLSIIYLSGIIIFKTNDDFGYYHLTYTKLLTENSIPFGLGNLGHGFRTPSFLFYLNSINYLPGINFYSFHFSIFYIFLFSSIFLISKIFYFLKKNYYFLFFLTLFIFIFHNNIFYRFSEYGVDRTSQALTFLSIIILIEIIFDLNKNQLDKEKYLHQKLILLIMIICIAASFKAIFLIYILLLLRFLHLIFRERFIKFYFKPLFLCTFLFLFIFIINFMSTGCLLYPADLTCFDKFTWSIPKEEVKSMMIHYEWWAKAGGGPGYANEIDREIYIQDLNWLVNWIDRHFFNKVSDFLLSLFFIGLVITLVSRYSRINNIKKKKEEDLKFTKIDKYFFLSIYFFIFLEWFFNHPSMRYGGFFIIAIPIIILFSNYLTKFIFDKKKLRKASIILVLTSLIIFNFQNFKRLKNEISQYKVNILNSPYFIKPDVVFLYKNISGKNFYKPKNNMCWDIPTPCSGNFSYSLERFLWTYIIGKK